MAKPRFMRERQQFRALLLSNPNYFGNLKASPFKPVLNIQSNTTYEEIGCVGFQPQFNRLEAVVYIKQPSGYGGDICSSGTTEYVRFYISFDDGATWQDQGLSCFAAYNISEGTGGGKHLEYAVTRKIGPLRKFCFVRNIARVRAILSWNVPPPPNDPDFPPIWGNVYDTQIMIDPLKLFPLGSIFQALKLKVPVELAESADLEQMVAAKPKMLTALELQKLYKGKKIEPHRYALVELQKLIAQPAASESPIAPSGGTLIQSLGINLAAIIAKFYPVDGDTSYEELDCVGLNSNEDMLCGILRIKLPSGYSGGACTAGSKEFVTFWADYDDNGVFESCLGTTSVNVYDVDPIPNGGLEFAVFLPVDLSAHRRPCSDGPVVVRVRAVLSWQVPPPCYNPDYIPIWGNREETLIHISPGPIVGSDQVPLLSSVGDIFYTMISPTGSATGATIHTGFDAEDSPFGGTITLAGHISNATPGLKYRVMRKPHGAPDTSYVPLTNEPLGLQLFLNTWDPLNGWIGTPLTVHADPAGYYPFEDYSNNHSIEESIVGRWFSTVAEDGLTFDLRIDLSVDGNPANDVHSNVVTVLIDNTAPHVELSIQLAAGGQCADFDAGAIFTGSFKALDAHFKQFSFEIVPNGPPNNPPHGVLPVPPSGTSVFYLGTITDPGVSAGSYTLNTGVNPGPPATGPMDPCGYALLLHVYDRTNVNSGAGNNYNKASVGFCLRAK